MGVELDEAQLDNHLVSVGEIAHMVKRRTVEWEVPGADSSMYQYCLIALLYMVNLFVF